MGTASGTFLSTLGYIKMEDVLITSILAIIGALISFIISCFLNIYLKPKLKKKKNGIKNRKLNGIQSYPNTQIKYLTSTVLRLTS